VESLLLKNVSIYYPPDTYHKRQEKEKYCRIHWIFQRPSEVYGLKANQKSNTTIKNLYRQYRLIGSSL
jgi:hypothetical protein